MPVALNFALLGNPGTGKTTSAKLLARVLHEVGVRASPTLVETTGEELMREGADFLKEKLDEAKDGVLFIDDAHAMDAGSKEGRALVMQLLHAADELRETTSIIIAGYKEEIEEKLFAADPGFKSRFSCAALEDFTFDELRKILWSLIEQYEWTVEDPKVVDVAARRVSRGRGMRGFANARAVRTTFEGAYSSALERSPKATELAVSDFIGPAPTPETRPKLRAALDDLDGLIGLAVIKQAVRRLVVLAKANYDRELRGQAPLEMAMNRLFLVRSGSALSRITSTQRLATATPPCRYAPNTAHPLHPQPHAGQPRHRKNDHGKTVRPDPRRTWFPLRWYRRAQDPK